MPTPKSQADLLTDATKPPKYTLAKLDDLIVSVWNKVDTPTIGGSPGGSTGQVQFNSSGAFGASNLLFWDDTNKRLGIGTASPTATLEVENAWKIFQNGGEARMDCVAGHQFVFNASGGEAIFASNYGSSGTHRFSDSSGVPYYRMLTAGGAEILRLGGIGSVYAALQSGVGPLTVLPVGAATVVFVVQAAASQTANLTEWQNSSGTAIVSIGPTGYFGNGAGAAFPAYPIDARAKQGHTYARFGTNFGFSDAPEASDIGRGAFGRDDGSEIGMYNYNGSFGVYTANNSTPAFHFGIGTGGEIKTNQTAAASTPGTVVGKMPVYNAAGTLVGYTAIYDAIT